MLNRRSFLKTIVAASSVPVIKCFAVEASANGIELNKLSLLYKSWLSQYEQTPENFLASLGHTINDPSFYKSKIKDDFMTGNVFEFDGLVMSKTEAAGLSSLIHLSSPNF